MKKISLLVASLMVIGVSSSAFAATSADGTAVDIVNTGVKTVAHPDGGAAATADYTCSMIGVDEPAVKVSASTGVSAKLQCDTAARGIGVAANHPQGRSKACGANKDQACNYAGSSLGGKTMALGATDKPIADAVSEAAAGTLTETAATTTQ